MHHIPARYNVTTKTLEPPQEVIKFEDSWGDEEQLVQWISQKEHLVHHIARIRMEKYLDELKALLKSGQPFVIAGVGQLKADVQGTIHFTPQDLPIIMDTLDIQPVIRPDATHRVTIGNKEVVNNQVVNHLSASSENAGSYPEYPGYPESTSNFRWWWVAVPAAVIVAVALVWWIIARQSNVGQEPVISADRDVPADTSHGRMDSSLQEQVPAPASDTISYKLVIEDLHNIKEANAKLKRRKGWLQNNQDLQEKLALQQDTHDTNHYMIVVPWRSLRADTTKAKDSISNVFREKVHIIYF